jgi:hypothetical protein
MVLAKKMRKQGRLTESKHLTLASGVGTTLHVLRGLRARLSKHDQAAYREDIGLSNSGYESGCEL